MEQYQLGECYARSRPEVGVGTIFRTGEKTGQDYIGCVARGDAIGPDRVYPELTVN